MTINPADKNSYPPIGQTQAGSIDSNKKQPLKLAEAQPIKPDTETLPYPDIKDFKPNLEKVEPETPRAYIIEECPLPQKTLKDILTEIENLDLDLFQKAVLKIKICITDAMDLPHPKDTKIDPAIEAKQKENKAKSLQLAVKIATDAIEKLKQTDAPREQIAELYGLLSVVYLKQDKPKEAELSAKEYLNFSSDKHSAYDLLCQIYIYQEKYLEASKLCSEWKNETKFKDSDEKKIYKGRASFMEGLVRLELKDFDKAKESFNEALSERPDMASNFYKLMFLSYIEHENEPVCRKEIENFLNKLIEIANDPKNEMGFPSVQEDFKEMLNACREGKSVKEMFYKKVKQAEEEMEKAEKKLEKAKKHLKGENKSY